MESVQQYQCDVCDRLCKTERGLTAHRQTHFSSANGEESATPVSRLLTCRVCSKQYKTEKNLQKHLRSHSDETTENHPHSTSANLDFDEESFWTDDLIESFRNEHMGQHVTQSPALVYCSMCKNKGFNSIDKFITHRKRHAMQDAYAKAPSLERAKLECLILAQDTLTKLEENKLNSPTAQEMKRLARVLKENLFSHPVKSLFESMVEVFMSCFVGRREFFVVSALTEAYLSNVAFKCADMEVRHTLLALLLQSVQTPHANMFLTSVMRQFSQLLLAFALRMMSQGENGDPSLLGTRYANRTERTDSEEFAQTMHYVGGANIKKILRVALRLRNPNDKSLDIIDAIRSNFLIVDLAVDTDERLMAWTEAQDRGGLCKINTKVLQFFVQLGATIQPLERADGSLFVSEVMEKVCSCTGLMSMWDEIIAGKLNEEVAFELLHELVCHFCVTYRNGIISRRLDEWACDHSKSSHRHGTGGVSFRARLA